MIGDELRPIMTEFVAGMLNDPRCESILLDAGKDARVGSDLPPPTRTSPGNGTGALFLSWEMSIRRVFETATRTKR